jgi:5-methylcytosine-specific restriction enzyme B
MNEEPAERVEQPLLPHDIDPLVRGVAPALIEHGFGKGFSFFDPARKAWSLRAVDELFDRYVERPDLGKGRFLEKLHGQIGSTSDDAILLAAELLTLQALPLSNLTKATKIMRIEQVLGWMRDPVTLPADVEAAFSQGTWNGGTGANTLLWKWLSDAVRVVQAWWNIPEHERTRALTNPWSWRDWIHAVPVMNSLREGLLYLAFPGYFLPIVNLGHKTAIRKAFGYRLHQPLGDLDRDLYLITLDLQHESGGAVDYYLPPFVQEWRTKADPAGEQRAWLVRPRPGGQALVQEWQQEGFVSLAGAHLGAVQPGAELTEVRASVEEGYQHLDYAQRVALANEYYTFLSRMAEGHIVTTVVGNQLYLGVLAGEPTYDTIAEGARLRRSVVWQDTPPLGVDTLPAPLPAELDHQGTVVDLTGALDALSQLLGTTPDALESPDFARPKVIQAVPRLPPATAQLAFHLNMDQSWLQELIDLLQDRQQVVLYGPPGTGKTYIAQELALHVAERGAFQLVQFHPSYAYEDFFEGFRPLGARDGGVGFTLTPGPLRRMAAQAQANPGEPYVLIVDEINRANLAKVFGELYFLLEYRGKSIPLQYSPDESFSLPPNLFFIGTMNTADRSIALLDSAIRRRFAFVELHPDDPPVRDVLTKWLEASHKEGDERPALLRALNDAIGEEDRDFKIGPSYLMRTEAGTPAGLDRVWRHDLLPLLEEHYYGRLTRSQAHSQFGLEAIRRRIAVALASSPPPATDVGQESSTAAFEPANAAEADQP